MPKNVVRLRERLGRQQRRSETKIRAGIGKGYGVAAAEIAMSNARAKRTSKLIRAYKKVIQRGS